MNIVKAKYPNRKITKNTDSDFAAVIAAISEKYKGVGGDSDAESIVLANKRDLADGFVRVSSSTKDVAQIAKRLSVYILEVMEEADSVTFKVDKSAFRGIKYAFRIGSED